LRHFWYHLKDLFKSFQWPFRSLKLVKYSQSYGLNEVCDSIIFSFSSPSGTYIHSSFMTIPSSTIHSSSLSVFIPIFFSSSTAFTTFSSLPYAFLIFSLSLFSSTNVFVLFIYPGLISIWSWLSFFTSFCQSGLLLNLSAFPMLFPGVCLRVKFNYNRYNAYLACLLFSF